MGKWSNLRNTEAGRYKFSTMVVSALLVGVLLWQGVFAMLGGSDDTPDLGYMSLDTMAAGMETFSTGSDLGAIWENAVQNPSATGGVWGRFWTDASAVLASGSGGSGTGGDGSIPGGNDSIPGGDSSFPENLTVGQRFRYNGIDWLVLATDGDARLIITEHVFGVGTLYNPTNTYTRLSQSTLRQSLNFWAEATLGTLRQRALIPIGVDNDVRSVPGNWNPALENAAAGFTSPGARTNSDSAVFVLSMSELNQYFGPSGVNGNTPENQEALIARDTNGSARDWWTRSPGLDSHPVTIVFSAGSQVVREATDTNVGFRPALWISI